MPGGGLSAALLRAEDAADDVCAFYAGVPPGSLYQQGPWLTALQRGFDLDPMWLVWREGEDIRGVLPVTYSLKRRNRLVSLPFSHPVEPVWNGGVPDEAWECAWEAIRRYDFDEWVVKDGVPGGEGYALAYTRSVVSLDGSLDDVRSRYRANTRTAIRQAQRAGLRVRAWSEQDTGLLQQFIDTHHRRLAIPTLPAMWISALEDLMADGVIRCLLVQHNAAVLAVAIDLSGKTCVGTFACSVTDPDLLRMRPNDLLRDASIAAAHADGSRHFDMGSSRNTDDGALHHKRGFGAEEEPVRYTFFGMQAPEPQALPERRIRLRKTLLKACPAMLYPALSRVLIRSSDW